MLRSLYANKGSAGTRAFFIALVMLLNLVLPSLSGAVAYADTAEPEVPVVAENTEEVTEETSATDEVDEPEADETEEQTESTEESRDTTEESAEAEEQALTQAVVETDDHDESELLIQGRYKCYYRVSLEEYVFVVKVSSSDDVELEAGSEMNRANPETYNDILPTEFEEGEEYVKVTGWDGEEFEWELGSSEMTISQEEDVCHKAPTVLDVIDSTEETEILSELLRSESPRCFMLAELFDSNEEDVTVFAPSNTAIQNIVRAPSSSLDELTQLAGNADELCALIASHVVVEAVVVSTDATPTGVTLPALDNDLDGIFVQLVGPNVKVDDATVVMADLFGSNGVVHVVNDVLLPQSYGTINPIETDNVSPMLSGTIVPPMMEDRVSEEPIGFCVLVRIDGVAYTATVEGLSWTIPAGIVKLNPTDSDTLFDVVVRTEGKAGCDDSCEPSPELVMNAQANAELVNEGIERSGDRLVGLTMARGVVSYPEPEPEEPEEPDTGEVLGTTTDEEVAAPVSYAPSACGKGVCGDFAQAYDPNTTDSDGDGVVDAEDADPNDPNVKTQEELDARDAAANQTDESNDSADESDDSNNVFWWFVVGGGVVILAYLYRQRTGGSVS